MPNVSPNVPELYLCTPVKVDPSRNYYIVGFEPNATMETAHHMLLYGCTKPGSTKSIWDCGEMAHSLNSQRETAVPCSEGSQILYAWARDAPRLNLPEGVGFKVGGDSPIKYIVLQVHYAHIDRFKDGSTDDSGVFLHYILHPLNKLAGVLLLGTGGSIPPRSTEYMETACILKENKTIYPIAYRTHSHSLGRVISGYVIKPNWKWIELARCTMQNMRDTWTNIGPTNEDEMCNFYLMYYVENDEPLNMKYCFTPGPPVYYWENDELRNIPDKEASTL
ncbi:hypothetical protein HZH66_010202 [Vespula vulgaris]|uniref:peptidylglycine monooxygenase n=1 Tax=Vespula vulgaris TaxID=7454 RepID=A0A834JJ79_VESVU|nr:hypothetical protein HZH66_010202 [Vespula vulgaris]